MEKENIFGVMLQLMKVNGLKTELTAMEVMNGQMEELTLESGETTICMVVVSTLGKMEEDMKANILMIKSTDMVLMFGKMVVNMKVNGRMENNMEKVFTVNKMDKNVKVDGRKEKELLGLMQLRIRI